MTNPRRSRSLVARQYLLAHVIAFGAATAGMVGVGVIVARPPLLDSISIAQAAGSRVGVAWLVVTGLGSTATFYGLFTVRTDVLAGGKVVLAGMLIVQAIGTGIALGLRSVFPICVFVAFAVALLVSAYLVTEQGRRVERQTDGP